MSIDPTAPLDKRGQFIGVRHGELVAALIADLDLGGEEARAFERLLAAVIHYEFHAELEQLHEAYHLLDPTGRALDRTPDRIDAAFAALSGAHERVLKAANFIEVDISEVQRAGREAGRIRYALRAGTENFRSIRLFRRGGHTETHERRSWWGLRRRDLRIFVYDEVVLFAALKSSLPEPKRRKGRPVPPGAVMIKCFHGIAAADLDALYPNVRVVMTVADKLMLGLPALFAGIPLLIKLAPALFVLYGLLRFYTGDAPPGHDGIGEALMVASGIIALGGFLANQWIKYERRSLRYQKEINDTIYFHNVTNNGGIFDHIIGNAEEQERKETLLAYFFLLAAEEPLAEPELDRRIETWLRDRFGFAADFDVADALGKLRRYGLLKEEGERLSVLPLAAALRQLDSRWDQVFSFDEAA